MKTPQHMRATITRAYGGDVIAGKNDHFVRGFFERACKSGVRLDAAGNVIGDPDPDDTAHRSARGANSAVRDPNSMPNVADMELGHVKAIALSIGSYAAGIRAELASAVLDRLRELDAEKLADMYEAIWAENLDAPSDEEAERSGAAHSDDTDEEAAAHRLKYASVETPRRGRTRQQVLDEMNPQRAKRRSR